MINGKCYQVIVKIPFNGIVSLHAFADQVLADLAGNFEGSVGIRDSLKEWPDPWDV